MPKNLSYLLILLLVPLLLATVTPGGLTRSVRATPPPPVPPPPATTQIEGSISADRTGTPLDGAVVSVSPAPEMTTTTDAAGRFVLAAVPITGTYRLVTITVQAAGYGTWTMRETVLYPGITRLLDVRLGVSNVTVQAGLPLPLRDDEALPDDLSPFPPLPPSLSAVGHDVPPTTIRVARTGFTHCRDWLDAGRPVNAVETYDFRDYVKNVLPNEWIARWHPDALRAGAMAIKNFAWYKILTRVRAPYGADILDNTCDQYFVSNTRQSSTDAAVDATWNYLMQRDGRIFGIHYLNSRARCDSSPYQPCMPQEGTQEDALAGYDWQWILSRYYAPIEMRRIGDEPPPPPPPSPTPPPTPTPPPPPVYSYEYLGQHPTPGTEPFWLTTPGVLELRIRNTGDTPWYRNRTEGCNIHLGAGESESSDNPLRVRDHISPFYTAGAGGWLHEPSAAGRRVLMLEEQVNPGQIATFRFDIILPSTTVGELREYWAPVIEGPGCEHPQWLPGVGMHFWLTVFPFHYSVVEHRPSDQAAHTAPSEFAIVLRNEGPATWYQADDTPGNTTGYAVHLATGRPGDDGNPNLYYRPDHPSPFYTPDGTGWWSGTNDRNRIMMREKVVPPGSTATFRFAAAVAPTAGSIDAVFTPVVEYVGWMEHQEGTRLIVTNNPYRAAVEEQSPDTTEVITLKAWETQTFTVRFRNTGYAPWEQAGTLLATVEPDSNAVDYTSPFGHSSWLHPDCPTHLQEEQVAPDDTGTFVFTVRAPAIPGRYTLRVRPLAADTWWMEDQTMDVTWTINVTPLAPGEGQWLHLPYLGR